MRRLSQVQYVNALQDVVARALPSEGASLAAAVPSLVAAALYPNDAYINPTGSPHGGFFRVDQAVQQAHIDGSYAVAVRLASELTSSSARMTQLVGACATDASTTNDTDCLADFIQRLGRQVHRRPLASADIEFYRALAGGSVSQSAIARVVGVMLAAPEFLYVVETGQSTVLQQGRLLLTAHELATRLALHFWNTIPDAELAGAADSGALLTPATYQAQVARLAADPRAERTVREFFSQWFELQSTPSFDSRLGDPLYRTIAGSFTPTAATRQNAIDEIGDLVTHLYRGDRPVLEVLTDNRNFARSTDIASLYGVAPWNGTAAPQAMQNRNLITRIAFLASGISNTRPILKGARIRQQLLCVKLPPPPPDAMNVSVEFSPTLTTREAVERLTEQPGTSCAACHTKLINPLGFITENYDPFGRARSAQQLFDATGRPTITKAVRTDAVIGVPLTDSRVANNAVDAVSQIAASGEFESCFARQYFRFTFGRAERQFDQYVIDQLTFAARTGQPLQKVMQAVALRPEFQMRMSR
jgi:hypothetical protein